jgi:hypothetical protein
MKDRSSVMLLGHGKREIACSNATMLDFVSHPRYLGFHELELFKVEGDAVVHDANSVDLVG